MNISSSDIRCMLAAKYEVNAKSGYGYELYLPDKPQGFEVAAHTIAHTNERLLFAEVPEIITRLANAANTALLMQGEPGSGKSHVRDDVAIGAAVMTDVPYALISLHINGSKPSGAAVSEKVIDTLESQKVNSLLILDNVDYLGYRGKSTTRTKATKYANEMSKIIRRAVESNKIYVLGTSHDEEWRAGRWTWNDESIDTPARASLEVFGEPMEFNGDLTEEGIKEFSTIRKLGADTVSRLVAMGHTSFFYFKHIDEEAFRHDPLSAIADIEKGRHDRKYR